MKSPEKKNSLFAMLLEWIEALTVALTVIVLLFAFAFRLVSVDGTSMQTTLQHGERLMLSRLPYTPAYEDIVVVHLEERAEPLIKRVIGLAGDTIEIMEDGQVARNGVLLDESYVKVPTAKEKMTGAVTVPEGQVFVMGDNRASGCSLDSRTFGCVDESELVGKVVFRLFPLNRLGGLYDES